MKKELFIGAVVGAAVSWFFTRRYYMEEIEACYDEIDRLDRVQRPTKPVKFKKVTEEEMSNIIEGGLNSENKIDRKRPRVNVVENVKDLAPRVEPVKDDPIPCPSEDIHQITEDDYDEPYENYDKVELTYNYDTNRLFDENGKEITADETISESILNTFCFDIKEQFIYVRNNTIETDFIVDATFGYEELAQAYQEEKEKILEEKNRGVERD